MYIPKDCYGKVLGEKEWHGSGVMKKAITHWQNGVGSYRDLEVILSDNSQETDGTIYFYKKTLEAFQKYVYDKYIDNDIHFTLTKYNNILNKTKIIYKIEASELKDISYDDIYMNLYESETRTEDLLLEDISTDWGRNVEIIENNIFDENDRNTYKLRFRSKSNYDLKISKAMVYYVHKNTGDMESMVDLLKDNETPGFVMNSEYEIVSNATKMIINNTAHFTTCSGLKNDKGCIVLDDGYSEGEGAVSLTDKSGLYVNYICNDCPTVRVPDHSIICIGGYWNTSDEFVVRGDYSIEDKVVKLNINANYLSFDISEDNINAKITMEYEDEVFGSKTIELGDQLRFISERTDTPRNISITMNIVSIRDVKFKNFQYSNYSIQLETKNGSLTKTDKGYKLGNFYYNELRVKVSARTGYSPRIEGIYIGEDFNNIVYTTKSIPNLDNCMRVFEITTNGEIDLITLDNYGAELDEQLNYRPYVQYKATDDNAYIRVDLSEYTEIEDVPNDDFTLERIEESGQIFYNVKIKNKKIVDSIRIKGTKLVQARVVTLRDMIKFYIKDFNPTYDKIYCSKCTKGLIIGRQNPGGTPYNMLLDIKSEIFTGLDIVKYTMILPVNLGTIYGSNNGYENRSNSTTHSFDYISIYPEGAQIYQAINEYTTCIEHNRNIPITNNFSPALDTNKLLFYSVELFNKDELKDYIVIRFHNESTVDTDIYDLPTWSIGTSNSYIAIQNNVDMLNSLSYSVTSYNIDEVITLSSTVDIKDTYSLTDNTILNTEKFIVSSDNEDITIKYEFYDGTSKKAYLLKYEEVVVEADGFNKLVYSNIDTIYHISKSPYVDEYLDEITDYNILKIVEGAATIEEKADIIAQRAEWRKEINELEEFINK